jgi:hypothetical protein
MPSDPDRLRQLANEAAALAARHLKSPKLYSVLVDFAEGISIPSPQYFRFGFQQLRKSLILGTRLAACWVECGVEASSLRVISSGTYGARQVEQLAGIQGMQFPPPTLELSQLRLGVEQVVEALQRASPLGASLGTLALSLCVHDNHLAWRVLQEVAAVGFRTLVVDARDGHVLFDKVDRWHTSAEGEGGPPTRP